MKAGSNNNIIFQAEYNKCRIYSESFTSEPAVKTLDNYFTIIVGTLHIRDVRNYTIISTEFDTSYHMYLKHLY